MTGANEKDGYIAARKAEIVAAIDAAGGLDGSAHAQLRDIMKLLGATLHYEAYDAAERLKALYDPLDPDTPPSRRDTSTTTFAAFETAFIDALTRANFAEIDFETVASKDVTLILTGLRVKASLAGIRRIRFFARGRRDERVDHKQYFGLRKRTVDAQVFRDVVVLVGFKSESEVGANNREASATLRRGVRPGAALVKHFRNVAHAELVTLHPGASPAMRPQDQVFLAAPAVAGGVPILLNLWPALTVLFAVLAAYFGAHGVIDNNALKRALAALSGLAALGAFVMRQRMKYETQTLRYQKRLAETVYFRNIANNAGVLDLLVSEGEDQDVKEALLGYWALVRADQALAKGELDASIEEFLRTKLALDINFEIGDALAKLERLGLVARDGDSYRAQAPAQALSNLDTAWDALFKFGAPT